MSAPDLSTMSARMEYAADVLAEFNAEYADIYQADATWRPSELRREAGHRKAEENEAAEREALAKELELELRSLVVGPAIPRGDCFVIWARQLVESGWRKGDSA